jgi:hypothetical protein
MFRGPSDSLLLLLASSLATKGTPVTEPYRTLILTSLSLHPQDRWPHWTQDELIAKLVDSFEYAIFGNHGTEKEAKAWLAMGKYLNPQGSSQLSLRGT